MRKKKYTSYNDFFTRSLKSGMRAVDYQPSNVISPATGV
jgi:phosphatidylserine decarboxylase